MQRQFVESIILANSYLIVCKIYQNNSRKTELARRYLLKKVKEALIKTNNTFPTFDKIKSEDLL